MIIASFPQSGMVRCGRAPPPSLRGALATKQSRSPPRKDSGLLRCARNDGVRRSPFATHLA
ncbi:hypothetical protein C7U92_31210 [Bradyrhizobium sp. WBOS7]|nr:hypothetical protein [Bradyrhizobium sp. WBOS2]MDD1571153.1 hypothetical protein [Bradyrhizobium sp. WBOS1]MDD1581156.1 hypothetical protein [Bradyrhizobium sp. WBOS7]MDD1604828.1 hypothetical protein [Bradyrhizobium sp. WBOS16]